MKTFISSIPQSIALLKDKGSTALLYTGCICNKTRHMRL